MNLLRRSRWIALAALCGAAAGLAAAVFLHALVWATALRQAHGEIVWALPLAGLAIGWFYHLYGRDVAPGTNLILDEIHDPKSLVPLRMAPMILISTVLTHLFGGSAGREGTAVQMGGSLAEQIGRAFRADCEERRILLTAGLSAGFGAAIGAPWAGFVFGLEVLRRRPWSAWPASLIASFSGFAVALLLRAPHSEFPAFSAPAPGVRVILAVIAAGFVFGWAARAFMALTHRVERALAALVSHAAWRPFAGGLLMLAFFQLTGSHRYAGLGLETIQTALRFPADWRDPILKAIATALTIGSGFKGGEFIPLVFIGTTLGSAIAALLSAPATLLAPIGFAAVFAGASHAPFACTLMAMELFGPAIGPWALAACWLASRSAGRTGIYRVPQRNADASTGPGSPAQASSLK